MPDDIKIPINLDARALKEQLKRQIDDAERVARSLGMQINPTASYGREYRPGATSPSHAEMSASHRAFIDQARGRVTQAATVYRGINIDPQTLQAYATGTSFSSTTPVSTSTSRAVARHFSVIENAPGNVPVRMRIQLSPGVRARSHSDIDEGLSEREIRLARGAEFEITRRFRRQNIEYMHLAVRRSSAHAALSSEQIAQIRAAQTAKMQQEYRLGSTSPTHTEMSASHQAQLTSLKSKLTREIGGLVRAGSNPNVSLETFYQKRAASVAKQAILDSQIARMQLLVDAHRHQAMASRARSSKPLQGQVAWHALRATQGKQLDLMNEYFEEGNEGREDDPRYHQLRNAMLRETIAAGEATQRPAQLYRGQSIDRETLAAMQSGQPFNFSTINPTSTSVSRRRAAGYSTAYNPSDVAMRMNIRLAKGARAYALENFDPEIESGHPHEVVLPPGQEFRMKRLRMRKGIAYAQMEALAMDLPRSSEARHNYEEAQAAKPDLQALHWSQRLNKGGSSVRQRELLAAMSAQGIHSGAEQRQVSTGNSEILRRRQIWDAAGDPHIYARFMDLQHMLLNPQYTRGLLPAPAETIAAPRAIESRRPERFRSAARRLGVRMDWVSKGDWLDFAGEKATKGDATTFWPSRPGRRDNIVAERAISERTGWHELGHVAINRRAAARGWVNTGWTLGDEDFEQMIPGPTRDRAGWRELRRKYPSLKPPPSYRAGSEPNQAVEALAQTIGKMAVGQHIPKDVQAFVRHHFPDLGLGGSSLEGSLLGAKRKGGGKGPPPLPPGPHLTTAEQYRGELMAQEMARVSYGGRVPMSRAMLWDAVQNAGKIDPFGRGEYRKIGAHLAQSLPILGEPRNVPLLTRIGRLAKGRAVYTGSRILAAAIIYRTAEAFKAVIVASSHLGASLTQASLAAKASGTHMTEYGREQMQSLAGRTGMNLEVLGRALGESRAGGVGGAGALAVVTEAARLGRVNNVDADKLAKPIAQIARVFGVPSGQTSVISEMLNDVAKRGPVDPVELAQAVAHAGPAARTTGVGMHDLTTTIMQLVRTGMEPSTAATVAMKAMGQIAGAKPGGELYDAASRSGIALGAGALRGGSGLTAMLAKLSESLQPEVLTQLGAHGLQAFAGAGAEPGVVTSGQAIRELREIRSSWGSILSDEQATSATAQEAWRRLAAATEAFAAGTFSPGASSNGLLQGLGHSLSNFGRGSGIFAYHPNYAYHAQRSATENVEPQTDIVWSNRNNNWEQRPVAPGLSATPEATARWESWRRGENQREVRRGLFGDELNQQLHTIGRAEMARRGAASAVMPQLAAVQEEQTRHLDEMTGIAADQVSLAKASQDVNEMIGLYAPAGANQSSRLADMSGERERTLDHFRRKVLPDWINAAHGEERTRRRIIAGAAERELAAGRALTPEALGSSAREAEAMQYQARLASIWSGGQPMWREADWGEATGTLGGRQISPVPPMNDTAVLSIFQGMEIFLRNIASNTTPSFR